MAVEDWWFQGSLYLMLLQAGGEDVWGWESHIDLMIIDYYVTLSSDSSWDLTAGQRRRQGRVDLWKPARECDKM